jgi:Xaa-Pro aminopeptidase
VTTQAGGAAGGVPLPPCAVATRLDRLRSLVADRGDVDALLVTSLPNIRYLTGFTGSAARLLVSATDAVFVTDGRYGDQAGEQLGAAGVAARIVARTTIAAQREVLATEAAGIARLGVDGAHVTWDELRALEAAFAGTELRPATGLVEQMRAVKDAGEIARIETACDIASAALAEVLHLLDGEITERAFAMELEWAMRALGASGPSFDSIVGAGANAALPHHRADDTPIRAGDLLVLDYGCVFDGYSSDMTRTMVVGFEPEPWQAELVDAATAAQAAGVAMVAPGVSGKAVHERCVATLAERGLAELFTHGTGHGVGLQIHEAPWLGTASVDTFTAGNVITVEPGVYRVGLGGVRVEDTVLVTPDGCRPLTKTPKDLSCLRSPRTT